MSPAGLQPGQTFLGRFQVLRVLGQGAMGVVYEVQHTLTLHKSALKVLNDSSDEDTGRFLREASAAGRIGNPHIVQTFDAGVTEDGKPWLQMELLQGHTLGELLRQAGRLSEGATAFFLAQTAGAVEAAHRAGIVHRDLKPENLFVVEQGGLPFIKVLDFGLAKLTTHEPNLASTRGGMAMGTPLYMAPEQMRSAKHVDGRADLYSLGVIAYECLGGEPPYHADSFAELAAQVMAGNHPPLAPDRASPAMRAIVDKAMALRPEGRFSSAQALEQALGPLADEAQARTVLTAEQSDLLAATHRSIPGVARGKSGFLVGGILLASAVVGFLLVRPFTGVKPGPVEVSSPATVTPRATAPVPAAVVAPEVAQAIVEPAPEAAPDASVATVAEPKRPVRAAAPRPGKSVAVSGARDGGVVSTPPASDVYDSMK